MRRQHTVEDQEPRPPEVSREQVLAHLVAHSKPASIREIAHGMELKHRGRRFLPRIIRQLMKSGEIEEIHGGRYRLAGAKHAQHGSAGPSKPALPEDDAPSAKPKR